MVAHIGCTCEAGLGWTKLGGSPEGHRQMTGVYPAWVWEPRTSSVHLLGVCHFTVSLVRGEAYWRCWHIETSAAHGWG